MSGSALFDEQGKHLGNLTMSTDITERKRTEEVLRQSEEQYRRIVQTANEGIRVSDPDGKTLFVNQRFLEMTGYSQEELKDLGYGALSFEEDLPVVQDVMERRKQGLSDQHERRLRRKDGSYLWAQISGAPITDNDGNYVGNLTMYSDITERKKIEELKDSFLGMVSHELRTPLTVIMGAANTALTELDKLDPDDTKDLLRDTVWGAESLAHLLNNLLELSRIQAETLTIHAEPIHMRRLLSNAVETIKRQSPDCDYVIDCPGRFPVIEADEVRLERILHNLLENAAKYSPTGSEIRVFARRQKNEVIIGWPTRE